MSDFQIITDSSCDIPSELTKEYQIEVIPFYVSFDQVTYYKEKEEMSIPDFYNTLQSENIFPKTSLPSVQDYMTKFTYYLEKGKDVLCICLSDKFSGSYQSAINAMNILQEEYPKANIKVMNSKLATTAQGIFVLEAAKMQRAGFEMDEVVRNLEQLKETGRIMFTVGTLEYLQKGGRIGKVSAIAGTMLNLKPLIVLREGELFPHGTVRGRKKSLKRIIEMTKEYFKESGESVDDYTFCLTTGTCFDEVEQVLKEVEAELKIEIEYPIFTVGVTIGTYTGPDPVGICFIKKYNRL
jgi:DegV family protein with EDD domain